MQQTLLKVPHFGGPRSADPRRIPIFTVPWMEDEALNNYLRYNNSNAFFITGEEDGVVDYHFRSQVGKLNIDELYSAQPLLVVVREDLIAVDTTSAKTKQELLNEQRYEWC